MNRTSRLEMARWLGVLMLSGALVACSASDTKPGDMPQDSTQSDAARTSGLGDDAGLSESELANQRRLSDREASAAEQAALREVRTFYFEFDKSLINSEAHLPLKAHADWLRENRNKTAVLNGYADERGTKEYNLALGERRANAIARFLKVNGVQDGQLEVVSFGEEFPADYGHSEDAWGKNRRVVLEYR